MINYPLLKLEMFNKRIAIAQEKGIFLSESAMAKIIGVTRSTLRDFLKFGKPPHTKTLEKYAEFTGKNLSDYIIKEDE
jgi:hypothetical protein